MVNSDALTMKLHTQAPYASLTKQDNWYAQPFNARMRSRRSANEAVQN